MTTDSQRIFDMYVQENDNGTFTVYGNRGEIVEVTKYRADAMATARRLYRQFHK